MSASELYPFEGHYFDHGGVRQHYLDEGPRDAPPVVMVHGNPTWSFYFRRLVMELRGDHRVVVPDHIGCGRSDKPSNTDYDYVLSRRVDDLERLLDGIGVTENVTLVVHDWGGMIGMTWATRHVERIARIVVLNTAAFPMPKAKRFPWQIAACRARPFGPLVTRGMNAFVRAATRVCTVKPLPQDVRDMYTAPYDSWANRVAIYEFVHDIPLRPSDPSWATLVRTEQRLHLLADRPMLICWGDHDFVFDHHFREEWERRFPDAQVHRFDDAGHYVLEDAGDRVAALVREFVAHAPAEMSA